MSHQPHDNLAFVDTETLGLDPTLHPIWELAVITGGEEYHYFVDVTAGDVLNDDDGWVAMLEDWVDGESMLGTLRRRYEESQR